MHKFKLLIVVKADISVNITIWQKKSKFLKLPAKYLKENLSHQKVVLESLY